VATQIAYDTSNASPRNAASPLPGTTKLWNMPSQFYIRDYAVNGVRAPPRPPACSMPQAGALCHAPRGPRAAGHAELLSRQAMLPVMGAGTRGTVCIVYQPVPMQAASCASWQAFAGILIRCSEVLHVSAPLRKVLGGGSGMS